MWPLQASILKLLRQMKIPKDGFPARGVVRKKSIGQVALQILPEKISRINWQSKFNLEVSLLR